VCLDQRSYSSGCDVGRAVKASLCRNQFHSSGDDVPARSLLESPFSHLVDLIVQLWR
jgi:hypothetical protein